MGYIYEAMDRTKETIAYSFQGNATKHEGILKIIDRRFQLHQPLFAAGWYLNPTFFYKATSINPEVKDGLYDCIEKLVLDPCTRHRIDTEL